MQTLRWYLLLAATLSFVGCGDDPEADEPWEDPNQATEDAANQSGQNNSDQPEQANDSQPGQDNNSQPEQNNANNFEVDVPCLTTTGGGCPTDYPVGLFITYEHLQLAQERIETSNGAFAASANVQSGRASSGLDMEPDPFVVDDMGEITFGWCSGDEGTLSDATSRLEEESDVVRTLALEYALTEDDAYADKALSILMAWAEAFTPINIYDFNPDFENAEIDGQTEGFCSDRPWNFALDAMWQTYGLINFSDAFLLLTNQDASLTPDEEAAIQGLLTGLIEAVNSSFHAWTRWADHHPNAGSYERYRSDNHLSWSLAGLLAGAAATYDHELANYVLVGGAWEDSRGLTYENPSHVRDVIDRAIEGDDEAEKGRIYEEKIERDPPVGYSFFHLWALTIVAQVAAVHYGEDIWNYEGSDGAGLRHAYDRYSAFVLGERDSPNPDQDGDLSDHAWHYEMAHHQWNDERFEQIVETTNRDRFIIQSWGPVSLLFGR